MRKQKKMGCAKQKVFHNKMMSVGNLLVLIQDESVSGEDYQGYSAIQPRNSEMSACQLNPSSCKLGKLTTFLLWYPPRQFQASPLLREDLHFHRS